MDQVHLYGIANCDTMKKVRQWLLAHGISYQFHDYKKKHFWINDKPSSRKTIH